MTAVPATNKPPAGAVADPAAKPKSAYKSTKDLLSAPEFRAELAMALPKHISADRFLRVVLTSARKNPRLLACSQESLFSSVLACAQLGLEPDDPRQLAYLVPFNNKKTDADGRTAWVSECTVMVGYRGMVQLARNSGTVATIFATVVHERDEFHYELGLNPDLRHIPHRGHDGRGAVVASYAVAVFKDGTKQFRVVELDEIEHARMRSKEGSKGKGAWNDDYPAMAAKTAVRRLANFLPQSPELSLALMVDEAHRIRASRLPDGTIDFDVEAAVAALPAPDEPQDALEAPRGFSEVKIPETQAEALGMRLEAGAEAALKPADRAKALGQMFGDEDDRNGEESH